MEIKVEFNSELPEDIVEKLLENPDCTMSDLGLESAEDYLEAMVIAAYKKENKDASMSELRKWAADDVAEGIEAFYYDSLFKDHVLYYEGIIEHGMQYYEKFGEHYYLVYSMN